MKRRTFIKVVGLGAAGTLTALYWPDEGMLNPCFSEKTPKELLDHPIMHESWQGINSAEYWDVHTHLIGTGDSDSGIYLHSSMQDIFSPAQYVRFRFYINASCSDNVDGIDKGYIQRLLRLQQEFPAGAKNILLAFDYHHDASGKQDRLRSPFSTPNAYAARVSQSLPDHFEWIASIHPYREDSVEELHAAVKAGARAIKWLPPVMGIDPSSRRCDRFYQAMVDLDIPLLSHAGDEHAVDGVEAQHMGNPLLLRRPLEQGVRVIVAHCASEGIGDDIDRGKAATKQENFLLFKRLMEDKNYEGRLFGDISAMTQLNRVGLALQTIITRDDWQHRLLNGSDYPLPGVMPLFSTKKMYKLGYLAKERVSYLEQLRQYNPLLFDFVLKRSLRWQGKRLSTSVFETRKFFKNQSGS
jgi:predicted TIM-barrel fold metal-dependent hydrolase